MSGTRASAVPARLWPYISELKVFEGFRSAMYLDTAGNVTVGYGTNLKPMKPEERNSLPFFHSGPISSSDAYSKATPQEIQAEYDRVQGGKPAVKPSLQLTEASCLQLLVDKVLRSERYLLTAVSRYRNFPEDAQFALIDLVYNTGSLKFPRLRRAIESVPPDWMVAAAESHRFQVQPERNLWTRRSFERAGWRVPLLYRTRAEVDDEMLRGSGRHSSGHLHRRSKGSHSVAPTSVGKPLRML